MNNFLKITSGLSVMPLLLAIRRRPELWKEDTYLRDYPQGPFGDTETIMLRFPVKRVADTEAELKDILSTYDQHENIDYPAYALLHEARPLVMDLMAFVKGERLGRVMVNKLRPGGRVFPHADTPVHAEYWTRFHIVLSAKPGCVIRCDDEQLQFQTGDCFWFNNKLEHEVNNNSADDRISMVVDIRTSR
ncbi:MAG: aspartyl/asparaginyl beta-hydroxylase domain-containing protein [Dokdonella sp.]